ncbi:MFS transporter [Spirosoma sp. SC4-14]|uniref:MFS transporter n=1 Tax=Spirosoma sp. SC4-14 TaxID=3128900 RepID=UPI0030D04771
MFRKRLILIIASISVFFEALDIAIVNLTMPMIQHTFELTTNQVQWLQTLYVLLYGGLLILGGRLADTFGRKRTFLIASSLFLLTSFGAGLAGSFGWLVGFRSLQGVAAALLMPSAISIVTNTFTDTASRSRAIGIVSAFAAIGSGSGLSVGGLVASEYGWQWVFFMNVPVILLTLLLGYRYIPADEPQHESIPDISLGLLLSITITALSYLVHELGQWHTKFIELTLLALLIAGGIVLFVKRNARQAEPLVNFTILKPSLPSVGVFVCLGASFTGYLFLISLLLQSDQHKSAMQAGILLFPFSILSAITGKVLLPILLKRFTIVQIALMGMASLTISALLLLYHIQSVPGNQLPLLLSMACANGIGIALAYSGLTVLSMQQIDEAYHGLASGVATTAYFFGGGLGLSGLSLFLGNDASTDLIVGTKPLSVLAIYAGVGVLILIIYAIRAGKVRRSPVLQTEQQ